MKHKYDFSKAERGKFYRRGAKLILPIYLDATLQKQLEPFARSQGKRIGDVVNDILKNQVQLLTTLNPSKSQKRVKGSHHIFRKSGVEEKINLQRDGNNAKPYQVKQVRAVLLRYKLGEAE